jgi:hypothetical protein
MTRLLGNSAAFRQKSNTTRRPWLATEAGQGIRAGMVSPPVAEEGLRAACFVTELPETPSCLR